MGDLYLDVLAFNLFSKRATDQTDPWGHYLFNVPPTYRAQLKWFGPAIPTNDIGVDGDYALVWGGFPNYGLQPSIIGPKVSGAWPGGVVAVSVTINPLYTAVDTNDL